MKYCLTGTSNRFPHINGGCADKTEFSGCSAGIFPPLSPVESPDTSIFPLIICKEANTRGTQKCFLNLPHHNKQGCICEGQTFSVHLFAFSELPAPNSTASALLSASASHYRHGKVKEMCCHGYMACY